MAAQKVHIAALLGVFLLTGRADALKSFGAQEAPAYMNTTAQTPACDGSTLSATVVGSSDAAYDTSRRQWASISASSATADARTKPRMIIYCTSDSHVQEAVSFAQSCGFSISVRSGGHNYAGLSSCPEDSPQCIQVDLSGIDTFSVDTTTTPARVTIGVGLIMSQVYSMLLPYGLTIAGGVCNAVGVGGHYQSSAIGYLVRSFGAGIDNVKSFRIVLADAQVHVVDENSDPDLYWALLGGGPGSWGIVLDYTVDTISNADAPHTKLWTFLYPYSRAMLHALGGVYSSQMADPVVARDLNVLLMIHPGVLFGFNDTFEHYILVRGVWTGIDNGALDGALYTQYVTPWESIPHVTLAAVTALPVSMVPGVLASDWNLGPFRFHIHAFAQHPSVSAWPDTDFYDKVADEVDIRLAIPYLHFSFQLWPFGASGPGSQLNRYAGKNAYGPRDVTNWVDDWVFFLFDSQAAIAEQRISAFRNATGHHWEEDNIPHSWMTPDTLTSNTHSGAADFSMNASWFARLQDVKTRVDPTDLFKTSMTIPPRASASAVGDPHLQNIHGERFDLMQSGWHTLLEIPRRAAAQRALLLVEAEAHHDGSACADMYFHSLNITGEWAQAKQKDGLRFSARSSDSTGSTWMSFGKVDLKVTQGHTLKGVRYLNFFVRHLAKAGFVIGGLLGEDDHSEAATPDHSCQRSVSLVEGPGGRDERSAASASSAAASLL